MNQNITHKNIIIEINIKISIQKKSVKIYLISYNQLRSLKIDTKNFFMDSSSNSFDTFVSEN